MRPASRKTTQVPRTNRELPNSKLTIATSFPRYTFPNCSIPGSSTLRSTLRCISLEQFQQYHALICLENSLFDAFPSIPLLLPRLIDIPLCGSIRFDRLAKVAVLHFSLAGQFLQTSRLARPSIALEPFCTFVPTIHPKVAGLLLHFT